MSNVGTRRLLAGCVVNRCMTLCLTAAGIRVHAVPDDHGADGDQGDAYRVPKLAQAKQG